MLNRSTVQSPLSRNPGDPINASGAVALGQQWTPNKPIGCTHPENEPCDAYARSKSRRTYCGLDDLPAWAMQRIEAGL